MWGDVERPRCSGSPVLWLAMALAIGLWSVAVHRALQPGQSLLRPAFSADGPTDAHNLRCIWLTAAVATLYVRPVSESIDAVVGIRGFTAAVMFSLLIVGSSELLMALRCVTLPPNEARRGHRARAVAIVTVVGLLVLSVLAGQPEYADVTLRWGSGASLAWMALFWGSWTLWCGSAGLRAAIAASRYAGTVPNATTRTSLRFLTVGGVALLAYAAVKSVVITLVIVDEPPPAGLSMVTLAAVTVMGVAAGLTSTWPLIVEAQQRRQAVRALREVEPLWVRMSSLDEDLVLTPFPYDTSHLDARAASVALYRACLEIADWMLILGERLPAGAWEHAQATVADQPDPDRHLQAAAGWIEAGLNRETIWPGAHSSMPELGEDAEALQRFITGVAAVNRVGSDCVARSLENRMQEVPR